MKQITKIEAFDSLVGCGYVKVESIVYNVRTSSADDPKKLGLFINGIKCPRLTSRVAVVDSNKVPQGPKGHVGSLVEWLKAGNELANLIGKEIRIDIEEGVLTLWQGELQPAYIYRAELK